ASRTVRDFIKELRSEGRTILLTTHNLPEADQLCDLIAVFKTRLLRLGTPEHLRTALFGRGTVIRVVEKAEALADVVRKLTFIGSVSVQGDTLSVALDNPDDQTPLLIQALVGAGALIRSAEPIAHSLEDVYLQLIDTTNNAQPETATARPGQKRKE